MCVREYVVESVLSSRECVRYSREGRVPIRCSREGVVCSCGRKCSVIQSVLECMCMRECVVKSVLSSRGCVESVLFYRVCSSVCV